MRSPFPIVMALLTLSLGAIGCGGQEGAFVTTSGESCAFSSNIGCIDIVTGYETKPVRASGDINEQNLLYVIITAPGTKPHGESSSTDFGRYVTTLTHTWTTDSGSFTASIPWDRRNDTVAIGNTTFLRSNGDIFFVQINTNGIIARQFSSPGPHAGFKDALHHLQQELPDDKLVDSMALYK